MSLQIPDRFSPSPHTQIPIPLPPPPLLTSLQLGSPPPQNYFPPGDLRDTRSLASPQRWVFQWWQHNDGHLSSLESLLPGLQDTPSWLPSLLRAVSFPVCWFFLFLAPSRWRHQRPALCLDLDPTQKPQRLCLQCLQDPTSGSLLCT